MEIIITWKDTEDIIIKKDQVKKLKFLLDVEFFQHFSTSYEGLLYVYLLGLFLRILMARVRSSYLSYSFSICFSQILFLCLFSLYSLIKFAFIASKRWESGGGVFLVSIKGDFSWSSVIEIEAIVDCRLFFSYYFYNFISS
mgnify:CR=1 FL=1